MVDQQKLVTFLEESNSIDNVSHVKANEVVAAMSIMESPELTIDLLLKYVKTIAPGAELAREGGGAFEVVLDKVNKNITTPFRAHLLLVLLEPFTNGSGRACRMIWYWHTQKSGGLHQSTFLQQWYRDSLKAIG